MHLAAVAALAWTLAAGAAVAADLQPHTVAAFDRYVRLTEARLDDRRAYLRVDELPAAARRDALAALRGGELFIDTLRTRDAGRTIDVPEGMIHHWVGVVFVPGATLQQAVSLLQDYDRHAEIYAPAVARSKLLARSGDTFRFSLRFAMQRVITVVTNTEHEARFRRDGPDRAQSRIRSTRIAEAENPGTPAERERPVGRDGGYLWRMNSYWRFLQRDGGVYIEAEAITLTRGIPAGVGWLVRPFVTSIPRDSLTLTLEATRRRLARA